MKFLINLFKKKGLRRLRTDADKIELAKALCNLPIDAVNEVLSSYQESSREIIWKIFEEVKHPTWLLVDTIINGDWMMEEDSQHIVKWIHTKSNKVLTWYKPAGRVEGLYPLTHSERRVVNHFLIKDYYEGRAVREEWTKVLLGETTNE